MKEFLEKLVCLCVLVPAVFFVAGGRAAAQTIDFDFDFRRGQQGWIADFADYAPQWDPENRYTRLFAGMRYMPRKVTRVPVTGFYIQGDNISADMFMFLKRRLTAADGVIAGRTYRVEYIIDFASNAAVLCVGPGGWPGESVILKAGASPVEPLAVLQPDGYLRMNVDKGLTNVDGNAASMAGNIANGIPCEQAFPFFPYVLIQRPHVHTYNVTASTTADLWLLIGTDSSYEAATELYYKRIRVKLTPV